MGLTNAVALKALEVARIHPRPADLAQVSGKFPAQGRKDQLVFDDFQRFYNVLIRGDRLLKHSNLNVCVFLM